MSAHAWIEVNFSAIRHNFKQIQSLVGPDVTVMAVVKANAYGHGLAEVTRALADAGAVWLAVSHVEEGAIAREAGYGGQILLMTPPRGSDCADAVSLGLSCCVMDADGIDETGRFANAVDVIAGVHLKVDTGMGRLGVRPEFAAELARKIAECPSLRLDGVYSHCSEGASEPAVKRQLRTFDECCKDIERSGIAIPIRHIAASAATLSTSESHLNAVRVGTLLYGQFPTNALGQSDTGRRLVLEQTWAFKTRITAIRSLPPGTSIGYGAEYQTARVSRVAILPVGIADGVGMQPVSLARKGLKSAARALFPERFPLWVTIRDRKAPILGRVAMNLCSVDVTDIPDAVVGDVVVLPVRRLAANAALPRLGSSD